MDILWPRWVTLFLTARTGGKTLLEMRASHLGLHHAYRGGQVQERDHIVQGREAISTFGGSWTLFSAAEDGHQRQNCRARGKPSAPQAISPTSPMSRDD